MNRTNYRLLMLTLVISMLILITSCGNQSNGEDAQQDDALAKGIASNEMASSEPVTKATSSDVAESGLVIGSESEVAAETESAESAGTEILNIEQSATKETSAATKDTPTKKPAAEESPKQLNTVTISIIGDEDKGVILKPTSIEWLDGDDVLDVLKRVTKSKRIPLEYRGSGMLSYVEGIANLYEFDKGAGSGWLFKINEQFAEKSAGAVKLSKGDVVEWIYSVELSEEPDN